VWATVPDGEMWNKDAPQVERQFDQCTAGRSLHPSPQTLRLLKCAQIQSTLVFF